MDNVTTLIVALFGGAIASLIAGYFARPKTKGEAAQANANATVSLSADAREWAQLWMGKAEAADVRAQAAEKRADEANEKAEAAEDHATRLDSKLAAAVVYMRALQQEINRHGGRVPEPPFILRDMWNSEQ
jgi:hypothetical protein